MLRIVALFPLFGIILSHGFQQTVAHQLHLNMKALQGHVIGELLIFSWSDFIGSDSVCEG